MKPTDLNLLTLPGRPVVAADGDILVALSTPDLELDRYRGVIRRLSADGSSDDFTAGPRDSAPVLSPDGRVVVFERAGETGPSQLFIMPRLGGEARRLTDHPLGASSPVFSADGTRIAYLAPVPAPGRYGTDDRISADAEPPRRITRMSFRMDNKGFVLDRREQLHVIELAAGSLARQVTDEPGGAGRPTWTVDDRLIYARETAPDASTDELAVVDASADRVAGSLLSATAGSAENPVLAGGRVIFVGEEFTGTHRAGRTPGLWSVALSGGAPVRLTDPATVHVEAEPVVVGDDVLILVQHRGAVELRTVPLTGNSVPLTALPVLIGGPVVVKSFSVTGDLVVAVVADPDSGGEVVTLDRSAGGEPLRRTDFSAAVRATGLGRMIELSGPGADGYPVHGWLVLPAGQGPHPVLLAVHGGPHTAYGWGLFDEAQVYAGAGYAVVLPNPRGSSSYGEPHGRAIVHALGTTDVDDVLAVLDLALARPDCQADRVGVMGGSYGGFMTSWLIGHYPDRFVAAISERAVNVWDSFTGSSDIGYSFTDAYVGPDRDEQWRRSPLATAGSITAPLLIIHSEHDWRCPIEQGQRLYVALAQRGAEVEMLLFPAEGHELSRSGRPQHRRQRFEAILQWWQRHLPVISLT